MKPCACNMKLDENNHFEKSIDPLCDKINSVIIKDVDQWSRVNMWQTWDMLYFIEDSNGKDGIVLDLKQMQNLARIFDSILEKKNKFG